MQFLFLTSNRLSVTAALALGLFLNLPPLTAAPDDGAASTKPASKPEAKARATVKTKVKRESNKKEKRNPRGDTSSNATPDFKPGPMPPAAPKSSKQKLEKKTWLGVAMTPVPESLREHLGLAEGFGIEVRSVVDKSPAQAAGLKNFDILTKLDDQILTAPEHLSLLIRSKKKGDKVTLSLIRKGKVQTVEATLGEIEAPVEPFPRLRPPMAPRPFMDSKEWKKAMERHQDQWKKMMERNRSDRNSPSQKGSHACPTCPTCPKGQGQVPRDGTRPMKKTAPDQVGRPPAISMRPGFPLKIFGTVGVVKIDNEEGELTLTQTQNEDDCKILIKDKDGNEIFSGPYDTNKGVAGLPEKAQAQLKKMKLDNLDVILPKTTPGKKVTPKREGSSTKGKKGSGAIL